MSESDRSNGSAGNDDPGALHWPEDPAEKALNAPRPQSVRNAIYAMIAGAVITLAFSLYMFIQTDRAQLRDAAAKALAEQGDKAKATAEQIDGIVNTTLGTVVVFGVATALLWLLCAFLLHRRMRWVRHVCIALTVLGVLLLVGGKYGPVLPNLIVAIPVLVLVLRRPAREWLDGARAGRGKPA